MSAGLLWNCCRLDFLVPNERRVEIWLIREVLAEGNSNGNGKNPKTPYGRRIVGDSPGRENHDLRVG